jgi:hypothetical protein
MRKVGEADTALALYGWCDDRVDMIDVAQVLALAVVGRQL